MTRLGLPLGLATAVVLLSTADTSLAASAKYPVKGLVKSGSQTGAGTTPLTVIDNTVAPSTTAGSGEVFVLLQACFKVDTGTNTVTLAAGTGVSVPFAASNSNAGTGCQSFAPGYVVPEGTDVTCAATGTANFSCTVSGVVTKKQ